MTSKKEELWVWGWPKDQHQPWMPVKLMLVQETDIFQKLIKHGNYYWGTHVKVRDNYSLQTAHTCKTLALRNGDSPEEGSTGDDSLTNQQSAQSWKVCLSGLGLEVKRP